MTRTIAFFPWLKITDPATIGSLQLLPYSKTESPGDQIHITQQQIDAVLGAYANKPQERIVQATILEIDDWKTGTDATGSLEKLFNSKELLAFACLSERRLFQKHSDSYCCNDHFTLIAQNFITGTPTAFSYSTRRRDGGTLNTWSSDEFTFYRPLHCVTNYSAKPDIKLLSALLDPKNQILIRSIKAYNDANTDSQDISLLTELVLFKCAFESLFNINEKCSEFCKAIQNLLSNLSTEQSSDGPLLGRWNTKQNNLRPLIAWAKEFCDFRGYAAHGNSTYTDRFVWSVQSHLAFASFLFPLLIKQKLSKTSHYQISEYDMNRLRNIDEYILHNPFQNEGERQSSAQIHPWAEIDTKIQKTETTKRTDTICTEVHTKLLQATEDRSSDID
jgi:hypothetical protein